MKRILEAVQSAAAHQKTPEEENLVMARKIFAELAPADQQEIVDLVADLALRQVPGFEHRA